MQSLEPSFSSFHVCTDHLGVLLESRLSRSEMGLRISMSNKRLVTLALLVCGPPFEK